LEGNGIENISMTHSKLNKEVLGHVVKKKEESLLHRAHSQIAGADTGELSGSILPGGKRFCPGANLKEEVLRMT
jgi:hypothetical protein